MEHRRRAGHTDGPRARGGDGGRADTPDAAADRRRDAAGAGARHGPAQRQRWRHALDRASDGAADRCGPHLPATTSQREGCEALQPAPRSRSSALAPCRVRSPSPRAPTRRSRSDTASRPTEPRRSMATSPWAPTARPALDRSGGRRGQPAASSTTDRTERHASQLTASGISNLGGAGPVLIAGVR